MSQYVFSYPGGLRFDGYDRTGGIKTACFSPKNDVCINISAINDADWTVFVSVGDKVKRAQRIAQTNELNPAFSPVCGAVKSIATENDRIKIIITPDGSDELDESVVPHAKKLSETEATEILDIIRDAGIIRCDGSNEPFDKFLRNVPKTADKLVVNCTECGTYLASVSKQLEEHPEEVVNGAKILMKVLGVSKANFAVEDNREKAVNSLLKYVGDSNFLKVRIVEGKYPISETSVLFRSLSGKRLSYGQTTLDYNFVFVSAAECAAVYRKFAFGLPDIDRLVTVSGDRVEKPGVFLVPLGTQISELVEKCGVGEDTMLVSNLLNGSVIDKKRYVGNDTAAVLAVKPRKGDIAEACIMCGRCFDVCPRRLMPFDLLARIKRNQFGAKSRLWVLNCIECNLCSYICPSSIDVAAFISKKKAELEEEMKAENNVKEDENGNAEATKAEEPAVEAPTAEEPASAEPVAEGPATEEPTAEEPVVEEPASEEPVAEDPTSEQPKPEEDKPEAADV